MEKKKPRPKLWFLPSDEYMDTPSLVVSRPMVGL